MRLMAPILAPRLVLPDIHGQPTYVGRGTGRRTLLCFFRDAACPFCNLRVYELTARHRDLAASGLDIVAVFTSDLPAVQRFVARHSRPFRIVSDPSISAHETYGIESSIWGKYKGILMRLPTALRGLRIVGLAGLRTTNLMPADFLVNENGYIVDAWYGRDAGDRIPFDRVEKFLRRSARRRQDASPRAAAGTMSG